MRKIMIVDDNQNNLVLMETLFEDEGYELIFANDGVEALEKLSDDIDVVVSDVMMPRMDGFQLCRRIKDDPRTNHLPVILVTAVKRKMEDLVRGLEIGADDYIIRPFDFKEMLAKIQVHIRVKSLYDRLSQTNEELKRSQEMKEELTHMVVHDLRNPVSSLLSIMDMLSQMGADLSQDASQRLITDGQHCAHLLLMMINNILDIHKMEDGKMMLEIDEYSFYDLVAAAVKQVHILVDQKEIFLETDIPYETPTVHVDREKIVRVLANLVGNSVKFTPRKGKIAISAQLADDSDFLLVEVTDTGIGIPPEDLIRIFDKFEQVRKHQDNEYVASGLGLTFCKIAVEAHRGTINVESKVGEGSRFYFTLPLKPY